MSRGSTDRRGGLAGAFLTVAGGLVLAGGASASWVEQTVTRDVAEAQVTETVVTRGVELAPLALPVGIAVAVVGVALAALPGGARRPAGLLAAACGILGVVDLVRGGVHALEIGAGITPAPGLAGVGALAAVLGGLSAARRRRQPGLPARFDIDAADSDAEWHEAVEQESDADAEHADEEWRQAVEPEPDRDPEGR